jgi:hypothetical protein
MADRGFRGIVLSIGIKSGAVAGGQPLIPTNNKRSRALGVPAHSTFLLGPICMGRCLPEYRSLQKSLGRG